MRRPRGRLATLAVRANRGGSTMLLNSVYVAIISARPASVRISVPVAMLLRKGSPIQPTISASATLCSGTTEPLRIASPASPPATPASISPIVPAAMSPGIDSSTQLPTSSTRAVPSACASSSTTPPPPTRTACPATTAARFALGVTETNALTALPTTRGFWTLM